MSKTSIEIDDKKLEAVSELLGTSTKRATVEAALDEIIARQLRVELVERLSTLEGLDLADESVMRGAWR